MTSSTMLVSEASIETITNDIVITSQLASNMSVGKISAAETNREDEKIQMDDSIHF